MKWYWGRRDRERDQSDEVVTHGELRLIVLHLLARKPLTGLEIEWTIDRRLAVIGLESASVATVIGMLEQLDYIRIDTHCGTYAVTADGTALLERNARVVEMVLDRVGFPADPALPPDPPVLQSLDALRGAIGRRLAGGGLTEAQHKALTRALNTLRATLEHA